MTANSRNTFVHAIATLGFALALSRVVASDVAPLPTRLSETGLYAPGSTSHVRAELIEFSPQYPLWTDGAIKRRWLYLPPGTAIDARDVDAWEFPRGTRLWKEFAHDNRVETRMIERLPNGDWRFATYIWNESGTDAELAPASGVRGLRLIGKLRYDVPGEADCRACHEGNAVPILGFSLLQLSSDRDPLAPHADRRSELANLRTLVDRGVLKNLPQHFLDQPPRIDADTPTARAALGYLHGNCGHCHNDLGSLTSLELPLAQTTSVTAATRLSSLVGESSRFRATGVDQRVTPGHADKSALVVRMRSRNPYSQMPPIGTNVIDSDALVLIERWINQELPLNQETTP